MFTSELSSVNEYQWPFSKKKRSKITHVQNQKDINCKYKKIGTGYSRNILNFLNRLYDITPVWDSLRLINHEAKYKLFKNLKYSL
jgi:hypothetical protein